MTKIKKKPNEIYAEYLNGVAFNNGIDLYKIVEQNNDFVNGIQWGSVPAPHLDKPVDNIIRPSVNYYSSQLVSDDIAVDVQFQDVEPQTAELFAKVLQQEIDATLERTKSQSKTRQLVRNEAVDGDMVLYSYYDLEEDSGVKENPGAIQTEIFSNTDIYFGNPVEQEIQKQPYVILKQRLMLDTARDLAKANGCPAEQIKADDEVEKMFEKIQPQDEYVTVLNKFWKEKGTVWHCRVTQSAYVQKPHNLNYKLYPISYNSWGKRKNCYHGVAPITCAIPNQILINKMLAATSAYNLNYAFPKVLYDKAKIPQGWSNDPIKPIAVNGDPQTAIFTTFKAADMSGQIVQLISMLKEDTKQMLGVYDAALGNVAPDNTSAIVATQKAANAPLELQRLDLYQFMEDTILIWFDIMQATYGIRPVYLRQNINGQEIAQTVPFDFAQLQKLKYKLDVTIGATNYWSEIAQASTMDNMLQMQVIPPEIYAKHIPRNFMPNRDLFVEEITMYQQQQQQMQMQQQQEEMQRQQAEKQLDDEGKALKNAKMKADLTEKIMAMKDNSQVEQQKRAYMTNMFDERGELK